MPTKRPRPKRSAPAWDADKVKALREHLGLTQEAMAQELGTQQQTVSEWERGYHQPKGMSVKMLTLVAEKAHFRYHATPSEEKAE